MFLTGISGQTFRDNPGDAWTHYGCATGFGRGSTPDRSGMLWGTPIVKASTGKLHPVFPQSQSLNMGSGQHGVDSIGQYWYQIAGP